ncbi:Lon protease family protein [Pantoea sp. Mhis]|uniref:AAA family ATPase n=1 Tax=Pantoea sp. Mhis TaxID=2576759 RepID=UPI00135C0D08|nr:Lon protease family protein [Pantoea sp. Mhis]MXP56142.1 Lon protease family protein [Pantoea sp. Mhis]
MTNNRLTWRALQPNSSLYESTFSDISFLEHKDSFAAVQPRLFNALAHLHHQTQSFPLLLLRSQQNNNYLSWIAKAAQHFLPRKKILFGGEYQIIRNNVKLLPPSDITCPFTTQGGVYYANWIESKQFLGCIRKYKDCIQPEAGLIHQANGGTLILSIDTLLAQPSLWLRLRTYLEQGYFNWYAEDEYRPFPIFIPPLPLQLRLVLCGDHNALANFRELDPEIYKIALYSEFEETLQILGKNEMKAWCQWTLSQIKILGVSKPTLDFWPAFINEAVRMTGDQKLLPLCPRWLSHQLQETALHGILNSQSLQESLETRIWRENFISDRIYNDILSNQIMIDTKGSIVGQINSLSVVEIPGHPRPWGEPCRITCVVHPGDGECVDIERKSELGGDIHTKGLLIMQSYLISKLKLGEQLPFSASLVFEQSYSEVNGDSASLAELCVLISALSNRPLTQQIAVTGSVDQFGNVQSVGSLNEKIESFFYICNTRGLTGKQGVILPSNNVCHLSLNQAVVNAVKQEKFHIWAIKNVDEALLLLSGIVWQSQQDESLLHIILERITQMNKNSKNQSLWSLNCFNWFKRHV